MDEQTLQQAIDAGQVTTVPAAPVSSDTQSGNAAPVLGDDYVPLIESIRRPRQSVAIVPTFTPQSFTDSIQYIDDGVTKRPGFYISGEWVDLATLIPTLAPPFDPFAKFIDLVHWES